MHLLKAAAAAIAVLCLSAAPASAQTAPVQPRSILTSSTINQMIADIADSRLGLQSKLDATGDASAITIRPGTGTVAQGLASYLSALAVPVEAFGTVCDGTTDASAALNAAGAAMAARGGGTLIISGRCLIDGADLTVPEGVRLSGSRHVGMQRQFLGYDTLKPALIVNPARTVRLGNNAALQHVAVARKGMVTPTDMRTALTQLAAFAGTAVTASGVQDPQLDDVLIVGFDRCVDSQNVNRAVVRGVRGDCNNGVRIDGNHDISRVMDTHFWPTLTANQAWTFTTYPVTAAANNGSGKVRVAVASHALVTGDKAAIVLPGVMIPAYVPVTVVDATHLDLLTVPFAGAYTTGGRVLIDTTRRPGWVFEVFNSESVEIVDSFGFGYQFGVHQGTRAGWTHLINTSFDRSNDDKDNVSIGVLVDDTAYGGSMVGGYISGYANSVLMNNTPGEAQSFTGVSFNPANGNMLQLQQGTVTFTGNHAPLCCVGQINIANSMQASIFVGNEFSNVGILFEGTQAANRTTIIGNRFAAGVPVMQLTNGVGGFAVTASDGGALAASSMNVGGCAQIAGTGDPNTTQVTAPVCTQYYRKDGSAGTTLYVKESGTSFSGWVAK